MAKASQGFLSGLVGKWVEVFLHPTRFFKKENKAKNLGYAVKGAAVAGVITAVITLIAAGSEVQLSSLLGQYTWPIYIVGSLIIGSIGSILGLIIASFIFYIFARALGGKATYTSQTHTLMFPMAAVGIVSTIVALIPIIGWVLAALMAIYNLYLLTAALKNTHKYTIGKAILTWLIPVLIITVLILIVVALATWAGLFVLSAA
ncbi:MAG: Yip1 family protein [Candidatus Aenigmarchaeota archaeon]|nr:Yip1 family protein [Candidatus Aenigmarchaeota archaeon]